MRDGVSGSASRMSISRMRAPVRSNSRPFATSKARITSPVGFAEDDAFRIATRNSRSVQFAATRMEIVVVYAMYDAVTIVVPGISAASDPVADTVATSGDELDQTTPPSTGWVLPLLKSSAARRNTVWPTPIDAVGPRILTPTNVMGVTGVPVVGAVGAGLSSHDRPTANRARTAAIGKARLREEVNISAHREPN